MNNVIIYSSNTCGYCTLAKRLLAQHGITPGEINIDLDPVRRAEMAQRTGRRTVPQIFIGERHVGGFDDLVLLERSGELGRLLPATR
ncbi:glutaredoxin 3 [Telluria aromaticivorans]|uniref:Glutaredoxin n=1 Tax=Telluria aromaticivorans TaxID=2725995 RepID=A0A7Y2JUY9_9BURK|nr:glutaredoxin 3 [Telluria aromaticivorans]NNG21467.1 glutaredoxin 3 [Telluria aromaticivorans]